MPVVGGKHYAYIKLGKAAVVLARKRMKTAATRNSALPKNHLKERLLHTIKETISRRQNRMLELQNEIGDLELENDKLEADNQEMLKGFNA